ncbi:fatty acyl-AMP ligase [Pseudenhygromyxa sp. WMMC2535]|uniref:fatty acyl-AMP ligase n=1 Tax=Pseudenhygromyxa sp. WMMC2535 TaxID=2712867 RepID=UPI001553E60B|nr:fatty acyl-AMP ligase [Pseudenhygromyxa sp. WMMC2535]NVB40894.1 fatty acyl-AMP ligase [Pseudenhygromyxa sp. WMMC2535]
MDSGPHAPTTLVDVLHARAQRHADRPLYQQLASGEIVGELSYAAADRRARALAMELREHAQPGERVLLLYPFGLEYPAVFLACLYAGLCAVPAFPPDKQRATSTMPRVGAIIRDADARLILTTADLVETVEFARAEAVNPDALEILATDALGHDADRAETWTRPAQLEDALAFLQYTSGSTGTPRGVMIGHDNLYAHQRLAHEKFKQDEGAVTVSWLPFYHDMGLIGSLLYPLYHGGTTALMSPTAFLRSPLAWLMAVSKLRARVSTGPNFAYDLCVDRAARAKPDALDGLDLSSWELTVSGAEPLRPQTIERFCQRFAPHGFRPETFMPCFGMAEATLMVSGWPLERAPSLRRFSREALWTGRAEPLPEEAEDSEGRDYVSCGTPMREHEVAIVDPDTCARLPDGHEGEIWLRGPSVGRGYWGDAETSTRRFAAHIEGEAEAEAETKADSPGVWPWFRTDDTGFVLDGELYGTGRLADLIVIGGRRYQPHDIERKLAHGPDALVKEAVVFSIPDAEGKPQLCIAATGRRTSGDEVRRKLCERIAARVLERVGIEPDRVVLIPQRSVSKTTSGKLRRYRYRSALRDGELEVLWERSAGGVAG